MISLRVARLNFSGFVWGCLSRVPFKFQLFLRCRFEDIAVFGLRT